MRRRVEAERPEVRLARGLRIAVGPAHAPAADLVERDACVGRYRLGELLPGHAAGEHARLDAEPAAELGQDLPAVVVLALQGDGGPQPLDAAVGVRDGAVLLGM